MKFKKGFGLIGVLVIVVVIIVSIIVFNTNKKTNIIPNANKNLLQENNEEKRDNSNINNQINENENSTGMTNALSPVIVYKTKADYFNLVPVSLSQDKTQIVSYPDPKDVYSNGSFAYPTTLNQDYLLDNRGVKINSAFLNIDYVTYSQLKIIPSISYLYSVIIDKDPFLELYSCQVGDTQTMINSYIDNNQLAIKCNKVI